MKKTIAFFLAALMLLGVLAGCTSGGSENTGTPAPAANNTNSGSTGTGSSAVVDTNKVDTTVSDEYEYRMPIADGATLSWWTTFSSSYIDSPADKSCYKEMEKRTGVHIDWQLAAGTNSGEAFNLMVMSQDYTDLINAGPATYAGGMDKAIEDEVYLPLNDYVTKWAPNFLAMMNRDEPTRKQQLTDQGSIAYFGSIQNPQPAWIGPMVRQDWLDAEGMAAPVTYDDWHSMLTVFKNNYNATLAMPYTGFDASGEFMNAGFGVGTANNGFFSADNTVHYSFVEEGMREYLTTMHQWYSEGLIDPDFYTRTSEINGATMDMMAKGEVGAFAFLPTLTNLLKMISGNPDYHVKAVTLPVKNVGDVAHFRRVNFELGAAGTVLTPVLLDDMEKLEIAVRYMDYRYTEEGSELLTYGVLGESYEYDENGEPQYLPIVTQNPDGLSFLDAKGLYGDISGGQWYRWESENAVLDEEGLAAHDIWGIADGAWEMPPVTLTTEEGNEYANIYGDIDTLVRESIPSFITGAKPLSDRAAFAAQIRSMGIDRCIELQQAALDRYNAR